jgi:hypothetical protein
VKFIRLPNAAFSVVPLMERFVPSVNSCGAVEEDDEPISNDVVERFDNFPSATLALSIESVRFGVVVAVATVPVIPFAFVKANDVTVPEPAATQFNVLPAPTAST